MQNLEEKHSWWKERHLLGPRGMTLPGEGLRI